MTDLPDRTWPNNAWLTYKVAASCWGRQVFPNTAQYILATPAALAASPEGKALVVEAEECVMRIAAGLFPGGYDRNLAQIAAAIRAAKGEPE